MLRPEVHHIARTERPTNFKLVHIQMEYEYSYHRQALWPARSKVKVTRSINAEIGSESCLPNGKAYELQTWYTDGEWRPVSWTSAMTSKVNGQVRDVTWCIWECCPISREYKVSETPKLVGRLPIPRTILWTSFRVKRSNVKVTRPTNFETESVSYLPNWNAYEV